MKTLTRVSFAAALAVLAAGILLLSACPNPVTQATFSQMTDKAAPIIGISSPANNSAYTQTVTVQGTAVDSGQLRSLTYTVTGTLGVLTTGEVALGSIGSNGSYSFQFGTISFSGPIAVTVSAKDWNDNVSTAVLTLTSPGSSVSSFTATPENRQVTLNWEPVTGAIDYTIYYTTNGTLPTETFGKWVVVSAPPHTISGLKNGAMHVFLLKARTASADYWSGYERRVPLSMFTLAPVVTAGYRKISLAWSPIDATDQFEVSRAIDPAGPYTSYTGAMTGTSFTDTNVADNTWYYYKVQPAVTGGTPSAYNGAQTIQLPPSETERIASIYSPAPTQKVKVSGNYAYVAAQSAGLLVVDITDPGAPAIISSVATTSATDVDINGNYAYVADGAGGLKVFDIANPINPQLVGSYTWGANTAATSVSVAGGPGGGTPYLYAFVLDAFSSTTTAVKVINVANPASPTLVTTYQKSADYQFTDVEAIYGGSAYPTSTYLYIPARKILAPNPNSGIIFESYIGPPPDSIVDDYRNYVYPNPSPPTLSSHFRPVRASVTGSYVYAYAVQAAHMEIVPTKLLVLSRSTFLLTGESATINTMGGNANDVSYSGTKVFVADANGIQHIDVTTPTAPVLKTYWDTSGASQGVATNGSSTFVASGAFGFQTINLAKVSPVFTGSLAQASSTTGFSGFAVRGRCIYAAAGSPSRLQVVDITNYNTPVNAGSVLLTSPNGVALSGDYAFVANGGQGLSVVNISNPASPVFVTSAKLSGFANGVVVQGSYAYLSANDSLQVFNVEDPAAPYIIAFYPAASIINGVDVRGSLAYIVDGAYSDSNQIRIIDLSDLLNPQLIGENATFSGAATLKGVSVYGDYAFITDSSGATGGGLYSVKVNPPNVTPLPAYGPCLTGPGATLGWSEGVFAFGQYALVADSKSGNGLAIIDITDPTAIDNTKLLTSVTWTTSSAQQVVVTGKHVFVTDDNMWNSLFALRIYRLF
jgi:hypothetical protein